MTGGSVTGSRTIKITLEYDGTDFAGWQVQPECRTVQGVVEAGLETLTKEKIRIIGAGRTDSGVHALGQVASFHLNGSLLTRVFKDGLNTYLPQDVRVIQARDAPGEFNARKHARKRVYRYVIARKRRVVGRQYAWYPGDDLLLDPMKVASNHLLGEHDFTSFCKTDSAYADHRSVVYDIVWKRTREELRFEVTAVRFFHHMIRIIIGTLAEVGRGKLTSDDFKAILESKDRRKAGRTAPPSGLFLVRVVYV